MVSYNNRELYDEFEEGFETYSDAIFRYCYLRLNDRERSLELTQEVFKKAWEYIIKGQKIDNFRSFIYKIARNLILNEYRDRKATFSIEDLREKEGYEPRSQDKNPEETAEINEVMNLLQKLQGHDQEIMLMRYVEGMSVKEISNIFKESENAISVKIHRAMKKLREAIN